MSSDAVKSSAREAQRRWLGGVLHSLSQPLTALHCALELALLRDGSAEEYRSSVNSALENAARLRERLLACMELNEADNPGDTSDPIRLDRLIMQLWEDLLPLAQAVGVRFEPICGPFWVHGNELKVASAFLYLLEWLLRSSVPDTPITLAADATVDEVQIVVAAQSRPEVHFPARRGSCVLPHQVETASCIFRAIGGGLAITDSPYHHTRCLIELRSVVGPCVG